MATPEEMAEAAAKAIAEAAAKAIEKAKADEEALQAKLDKEMRDRGQ